MDTDGLSPVSVQQRERYPGRGIQRERQTTQFTDGNSALHHIVCSWDSQSPEAQSRIIRKLYVASTVVLLKKY